MAVVGKVVHIARYPVKSMRSESLDSTNVGFQGIAGDRMYAFVQEGVHSPFPWLTARDYTPQARLSQHLKDLHLMLHSAAQHGMELPLVQTHRLLLEKAERLGLGDLDNCAVLEVLRPARG